MAHVAPLAMVLLAVAWLAMAPALAAPSEVPAAPGSASPAATDPAASPAPITEAEKASANALITDLYQAYLTRDLKKVLTLEAPAIRRSAEAYEQAKKGHAVEVLAAFRDATADIFNHPKFAMNPLRLDNVEYRREGDFVVVASAVPIISTVDLDLPGAPGPVRIRIAQFALQPANGGFEIVKMDMY